MLDLNALHSMMNQRGYHYFDGGTNSTGELYIDFRVGLNGRGNSLNVAFYNNLCSVEIYANEQHLVYNDIPENKVFEIIRDDL